jgi:hypothetical protein
MSDEQYLKAMEFAGNYRIAFPQELLRHFYQHIVERTLPSTATHAELAANNALRDFVVKIIKQVELAQSGKVSQSCSHDVIFTPPPPMVQQGAKVKRQRAKPLPQ